MPRYGTAMRSCAVRYGIEGRVVHASTITVVLTAVYRALARFRNMKVFVHYGVVCARAQVPVCWTSCVGWPWHFTEYMHVHHT
jgi:hypothetical protein